MANEPAWRVATYTGGNGDCVEVASWRVATYTGGGGGKIDRRLERDVFAYKPTVVTVMLGMNDASYRPFDQKIFDVYARGYEHLVESLKSNLPGVRITLIQPSPFDDVTREPLFKGLEMLRHRRHDVMVFHILDDDELLFPFSGMTKFEGLEEMPHLLCDPRSLREGYLEELELYLTEVRRGCTRIGIDYTLLRTSDYMDAVLSKFLFQRMSTRANPA